MNSANRIDVPTTKIHLGYIEAWYKSGEGLRVELLGVRPKDTNTAARELVLGTPDGVWRRCGDFDDFVALVREAYRESAPAP